MESTEADSSVQEKQPPAESKDTPTVPQEGVSSAEADVKETPNPTPTEGGDAPTKEADPPIEPTQNVPVLSPSSPAPSLVPSPAPCVTASVSAPVLASTSSPALASSSAPVLATPPVPPPYDLTQLLANAVESKDFENFLKILEDIELEAPNGVPPADVFQCMLTTYLIMNDVVSAKLLWQRIPTKAKSENAELDLIWSVGKKLWVSDFGATFLELNKDWSQSMKPLISALTESVRTRVVTLVENSYASVRMSSLASLLGTDAEATSALVKDKDWRVEGSGDSEFVFPTKPVSTTSGRRDDDAEALERLTDYVAFLEE